MSLAKVLATWFGCGLVPFAPGTAGSLAAVVLSIPFLHASPLWLLLAAALLAGPGFWSAGETARAVGRKDPQIVVIDEVIGQWVTLAGATHLNWRSLAIGFVLFRAFDIWKPFPVRRLEALPGGFGIVADDIMAGIYGSLVLFACGWFNFY